MLHKKKHVPPISLGSIRGSSTGEGEFDIIAGGWEGTDDATSTSPSDLSAVENKEPTSPEWTTGVAVGTTDLRGMRAEDEQDWEHEPFVESESESARE